MIKLSCAHADTCLSDYWSGHHLAHISVPVHHGMTFAAIRRALHDEVNAGAFAGSDERAQDNHELAEEFARACHAAINRDVFPAKKGARRAFLDLEKTPADFDGDEVMAFFVFSDSEESRGYYLRSGTDELEKAQRFPTMRAAVAAFEADARELARMDQAHEASVHIAASADDVAEYPDFLLTLGARGGVKVTRA